MRSGIAQKYSLSALLALEPLVDDVTNSFMSTIREVIKDQGNGPKDGGIIDLGQWVQYYAFDVIGAITFNRTFGFIKDRGDTRRVTLGIENGLSYGSLVGQIPELHQWLFGSAFVHRTILQLPVLKAMSPMPIVYKVRLAAACLLSSKLQFD